MIILHSLLNEQENLMEHTFENHFSELFKTMYNSPILLQGRIHTLIDAGKNKKEILTNLSELLDSHTNDILLCDFDDTITTSGVSTEAYYRGYCCASWICQSRHAFSPL